MAVLAPNGAMAVADVVFVTLEASWVQPAFDALVAAATFPMPFSIVVVTLTFVAVFDSWVTVNAVDLAVSRGPSNPVLFALRAAVWNRVLWLAGRAIFHNLFVAVFINNLSVVKRVLADALWHRLAVDQRTRATVGAHQFGVLFQESRLDDTNFALKLFALVASKTWIADAVRQRAISAVDALASAGAVKFARAVKLLAEDALSSRTADAHHVVQRH